MHIRIATSRDRDAVRDVHLSAFDEDENESVAQLAVDLLKEDTNPATFSLVAERDGVAIGHVAFSPVTVNCAEPLQGYALAPLSVSPPHQRRGVGSALVNDGLRRLSEMAVDIVFVYGDPKYYGRFGFSIDAAEAYTPPYQLTYPFGWQAVALTERRPGSSGAKVVCVASLCDPGLW